VVVPCWNDAGALEECLLGLTALEGICEIIVADASTDDEGRELARSFGAIFEKCSKPNRGAQMNAGAARATGEVVVFHHADSILTQAHVEALREAMRDPEIIGGAFHRKFDDRHRLLTWIEPLARMLNQLGSTLYGDQSIFVRREFFQRIGAFAEIPLMEDIDFSRRLRRSGRTVVLFPPLVSSARRHTARGAWKVSIENGILILLFKLGASPHALHRWYYRDRAEA